MDNDEIKSLQEKIKELEAQLELKEKMNTITSIKIEAPDDYDDLKKKCKKLEGIVKKYQTAYALSGISTLSILIDDYKAFSKKRLAEITNEILAESFDRETIGEALSFCDYLDNVRSEIRALISTHNRGKWINNPSFRKVKNDIDYITSFLNKDSNLVKIKENRYEDLHQLLCHMTDALKEFCGK